MKNKKIILKSNEAYNLINNAIASNRVIKDGKLLTPSEVEELIYYLLEQEYRNDLYSIELTNDIEDEQQRIREQLESGDIIMKFNDRNKKDLKGEVKSEKIYYELYKLRIDLLYRQKNNINKSYYQKNTNNDEGWAYNIRHYSKLYIHFHDYTSKYKSMILVINNPWELYNDCMEAIKIYKETNGFGTYNINGIEFDIFRNDNDYSKTTICTSFNLLGYEARERYNIDLIHLEVKSEW